MGLFDAFGDEYSLTIFAFVFVAFLSYATGATYSGSMWIGWLGLIAVIPSAIASALAASLGVVFLPLIVLGLFAYFSLAKSVIGPVMMLVWIGYIALTLGI